MTKTTKGLALLLAATACATESASEFDTSEMNARMTAVALGDGKTQVEVALRDPSKLLTFLQLTADDQLEASVAGQTKELEESSLLGYVSYHASFDTDAAEAEVRVRLQRGDLTDAPDSSVRLPAPFTLQPLARQSYSRAEPISLSWSTGPSPDPLRLGISGSCIESYEAELGTGIVSFTVPAGAIVKATRENEAVPDECEVTLMLERSRTGKVDPAFHGGSFDAQQRRSVSATSLP